MTAVEEYQAQVAALAAGTAAQVAAVYAGLQAATVPAGVAAGVIAAAINTANAGAVSLADVYVSACVESVVGVPVPTVGLPPTDDTDRLEAAVATILDDLQDERDDAEQDDDQARHDSHVAAEPAAEEIHELAQRGVPNLVARAGQRLQRLAESEPLQAAQRATVEVMDAQPRVIGWRRVLDADPCQLCIWLAAGGRVYRTTTAFRQHPNCNCQPEPVLESKEPAA